MKKFITTTTIKKWVVLGVLIVATCGSAPMKVFADGGEGDELIDNANEDVDVGAFDENAEVDNGGSDGKTDAEEADENNDVNDFELPILYIRAVNPGYKIDGINNVGEMIEIGKNSDDLISLAGITISYTNSSGKETVLVEFPENSFITGENILLRLASSPMSELANMNYNATLAMRAGPLKLNLGEEVLDSVCWTGKDGCAGDFKSATPTTLVRNLETGEFEHVLEYEPEFNEENYMVVEPEIQSGEVENDEGNDSENSGSDSVNNGGGNDGGGNGANEVEPDLNENETQNENENYNQKPDEHEKNDKLTEVENENTAEKPDEAGKCENLRFSEILTFWVESQSEQFVEIYNFDEKETELDGCKLKYKNKYYPLGGALGAKGYAVRYVDDFKLTKNPKTLNILELVDSEDIVVDVLEYPNGQKKGTSWALVDDEWNVTYAVTPGEENVYQKYRTCEAGKTINELTGNCVKEEDDEAPEEKICAEGQYLNPATGRCKKIEVEIVKMCAEGYYLNEETGRCRKIVQEVAKTCAEGQYLNPATGRCKKIEVEEEKTCAAGYYLNPATGRCKKVEVEEEKKCAEGYYLNEETGRCKKIVQNDGANYSLEAETYEEKTSFVALYAVLGVVGVGVIYIIYEFRREIGKFFKRLVGKK
ncbi:hypothetical protein IKX73_02245 [Candidatus Saccharibacteria bacterium]|nr:hypothetical protein [Candidatus Saccharibacteria bacterium]